ncbi:MAG: hypothetical protein N4A71_14725 [Carboxylicivirga sp.]|jgi:hypothetical protein|nr:hypothetical protein [Carboxylicivirga sp.]
MRFILLAILFLGLSFQSFAQLTSVVTSKEKEALNKYQNFVLVDQATQFVLAKEPVKYEPGKSMPTCFFSSIIPAEAGVTYASDYRSMAINTLVGADKEKWVICEHKEEGKMMFARRRFLSEFKAQYLWVPIVDGNYVIFLNMQGAYNINWGSYLAIDNDGNYIAVKKKDLASRWKLIYNK